MEANKNDKPVRVTIEYPDRVMTITGAEAEKWGQHNTYLASMAQVHGYNPFNVDPVKWEIYQRVGSEYTQQLSKALTMLKGLYDRKGIIFPADKEKARAMLINCGLIEKPQPGKIENINNPAQEAGNK